MPPKANKGAKGSPNEAAISNPVPNNFQESALQQLLPFLALGFAPCFNSGRENLCGPIALSRAFEDARNAFFVRGQGNIIIHTTEKQFIDWVSSQQFQNKVDERIDTHEAYQNLTRADRETARTQLKQKTNLDAE